MNNRMHLGRALLIPMSFAAIFLVQCSSGDGGSDGMHSGDGIEDRAPAANEPGNANTGYGTTDESQAGTYGTMTNEVGRTLSATEERTAVSTDLNGLRATLVAELEVVRHRLNAGTRPEDQRATDQERAAELAQGLERVDRALEAMGTATDETWSTMRQAQLKEVDEVRAWLTKYRSDSASVQS